MGELKERVDKRSEGSCLSQDYDHGKNCKYEHYGKQPPKPLDPEKLEQFTHSGTIIGGNG